MNKMTGPAFLTWMDDSTRVRIARFMGTFSVTLGLTGGIALAVMGRWNLLFGGFAMGFGINAVGLGAVALLVLPNEPRNGAVWTLAWSAVFSSVSIGAAASASLLAPNSIVDFGYAALDELSPSELPMGVAIAWWTLNWTWVPAFFLLLTLGFLLFPDGRPPTQSWRWLGWLSALAIAATSLGYASLFWPTSTKTFNALSEQQSGLGVLLADQGFNLLLLCWLLAVVSLFRRYRRTAPGASSQIRLLVWGGALFLIGGVTGLISNLWDDGGASESYFLLTGQVVFVASFAAAILKDHLYDIDVVISKTVTYVSLATLVAAVYVGLVVGVSALVGGRSSFGLSIVASVIIAFVFQPARRVVQRAANRLVFGRRATPYEVLARFSHRAAEASDEALLERVPRLLVDGTSAGQATLWVRDPSGFRESASWPDSADDQRARRLEGALFDDPAADLSVSVVHDGDLLGGLSLVAGRGERISEAEAALVLDVASGLGLALRNAGLTGQLRRQVAELEASRERVLDTADAARRALENDLDSGPQQLLVALKVKLGPTCRLAQRAGAEKTAGLLTQLESDAGEAIKAVREFAGGIYPPLLEAEGLVVAIGQQARKAAIPVNVRGDGIGRYRLPVEAAVYFSVLEALQNTSKYADATSATVTLVATDGVLHFEVTDDGRGFDSATTANGTGLNGMADRLDTVGGSVTVVSSLGRGTTVTGTIPTREFADT